MPNDIRLQKNQTNLILNCDNWSLGSRGSGRIESFSQFTIIKLSCMPCGTLLNKT